jgi:hypothetical protein
MGHAGLQVVGKAPLAHAPDARRARASNGRCSEFHRLPSRRDGAFAERAGWQTTQGDVPGAALHATTDLDVPGAKEDIARSRIELRRPW